MNLNFFLNYGLVNYDIGKILNTFSFGCLQIYQNKRAQQWKGRPIVTVNSFVNL